MKFRAAVATDILRMVELSEIKRIEYSEYSPVFWRTAEEANVKQATFFESQLTRDNIIALVAEEGSAVEGFVIASVVTAPPVYDPGGMVCVIDDFAVPSPKLWQSVGRELLHELIAQAKTRGAVLSVVVCGHLDEPKREMLRGCGAEIASEWYVLPIT